jgi:surface antigen
MWKRSLAVLMAGCLLASPALADSRHGGRHHGASHHRGKTWWRGEAHHHHARHHRARHRDRRGDAYLWLGLAVAGAGAIALLSSSQRTPHQDAWWQATRVPVGDDVVWRNPDEAGRARVLREGRDTHDEYCREFQHQVRIGGRSERAWGTACHQEDGSWRITPR